MRRRKAISEAISCGVRKREPDPYKGVGDWEAFEVNAEDWTYLMIADLPNESQDAPVARNRGVYYGFPYRYLISSISAATTSFDPYEAGIGEKFAVLANRWHDETDFLSSPTNITGNDTYLEIISMGKEVIPFILEDLKERGGNWYRALRILSGEDPVLPEARGDVEHMKSAWLQWGRERGYIE